MAKIYISSTYSDLKEYRERVYQTLRQMRHDVIGMEDYVASDQRPLDKCLADVSSCDLYIGIFARRYGYIPHKDNPEHKSITELEYRKAIEKGTSCLIFLLKEHMPWPSNQMDAITGEGEHGERISALRKELTQEKVVSFFEAPDQLARLVASAVHLWEMDMLASPAKQPDDKEKILWNVPLQRNPFFTGREDLLTHLHKVLNKDNAAALTQAISGLGGVGKTQTAIEYAYRHRDNYRYVFWVRSDTHEQLISDFIAIANLLNFPEKDAQDQSRIVNAVKKWLAVSTGWLLILDNADDLVMVKDFIPSTSKGHILLTTRTQVTGHIAQRIEIEKMELQEGTLFLLRRANIITSDASLGDASSNDVTKAREIVQAVDGLPLALDQVGAYIEETSCGLTGYLQRYQTQRTKLLKRRGGLVSDHPDSVATTWKLSFQKVEQANAAAADLLRLCAFLSPDAIPEEIITEGADDLGSNLQPVASDLVELDTAIEELRKYSLVRRNPEAQSLIIHRLVQAVIRDEMDEKTQCRWAERAVRAVNRVFPDTDVSSWSRCQRYLAHAEDCALLIVQHNLSFPEAARLLEQAGIYLVERGQYTQAEPFIKRALTIREQVLGLEHPDTAQSLNTLAGLYDDQGKYEQAEPLYQRALTIREQVLGLEHPDTAQSLNDLAFLYHDQGRYDEAESLYQRTLAIRQRILGPENADVAESLNNLAYLYYNQGKYEQAEPLFQRALAIDKKVLGQNHPDLATDYHNLALLYHAQGKYEQAEPFYQRALAIDEKALEPEHRGIANDLHNLARLYDDQGKYEQAEPLYQRALAIREQVLGPKHPSTATSLYNLAQLYKTQGHYKQAQPLYQRALSIAEKTFGSEHSFTTIVRKNYADLLRIMKQAEEATS